MGATLRKKAPGTWVLMFRIITPLPPWRSCPLGELSNRLVYPIRPLRKARIIELPEDLGNDKPHPWYPGFGFPYPFNPEESFVITSVGLGGVAEPGFGTVVHGDDRGVG